MNPVDHLDPELLQLFSDLRLVVFDFDGVFTDNMVYVSEEGAESVRCNRSDGLGLRRLDELGMDYLILSTETNPVVSRRAKKLGIHCMQGLDDKLSALFQEFDRIDISPKQAAFVGNDINDLGCLQQVGLPIAVADAHDDVLPAVRYQTHAAGGHGAVREICDLIYAIQTVAIEE